MIEYLAPTAGNNSLPYPIGQVTIQLTTEDLQNLNTKPYTILVQGSFNNVINASLLYSCTTCNTGINLFIGYEPLLGVASLSSFCDFDTAYISGNQGMISLGTRVRNFWINNSLDSSPLVLWQQADDASAIYSDFRLTITYLQF